MTVSRIDSSLFARTAEVARADGTEYYFNTHRYRFETILQALRPAPRTVLEVGTAPGYFTRLLVGSGYTVSGVDLAPERRAALWDELGVEVRRANLDQDPIPYPDQSFEHVVFCEVIEHLLFSPVPTLREIYRVLKPGGSLVLTTPNDRFVSSRLRLLGRMLLWQSTEPQDEFQRKMNLQGLSHYQTHARTYTMDELVWVIWQGGLPDRRARASRGVGAGGDGATDPAPPPVALSGQAWCVEAGTGDSAAAFDVAGDCRAACSPMSNAHPTDSRSYPIRRANKAS